MALGAIIGGIGSYFGSKESAKAAEKQQKAQINQLNAAAAGLRTDYDAIISQIMANPIGYAGGRVQAAMYQPVNLAQSLRNTIGANQSNLGGASQYASSVNRSNLQDDFTRANAFSPGILQSLRSLGTNAASLSSGQLPQDVIQSIIGARAGRSASAGIPGGQSPATLRDLGLSSLDAMNQGASLFQSIVQGAEQINPLSRRVSAQQYQFDPNVGLQTDLQQASLGQQSWQNYYNLAATPDPALALQTQLRLQMANNTASTKAGIAGLPQAPIPNYAGLYGQIGQGLGNLFGGMFGGGSGGGGGMFG